MTIHGDMDCFRVETPTATYVYGKQGAGFASILDKDGRDWVSYRPGGKARGEYRGLPKCGQPTKFFHCGYGYGQYKTDNPFASRVTAREAGHARIESETRDGKSACAWDFYPDHATMTLLRIDQPDLLVPLRGDARRPARRRGGLRHPPRRDEDHARRALVAGRALGLLRRGRDAGRAGPGQPPGARAGRDRLLRLLAVPEEADGSFQDMTVFGFGRKGYKELVQHVPDLKKLPARFSIAFVDRADAPTAKAAGERLLAAGGRGQFFRLHWFEHGKENGNPSSAHNRRFRVNAPEVSTHPDLRVPGRGPRQRHAPDPHGGRPPRRWPGPSCPWSSGAATRARPIAGSPSTAGRPTRSPTPAATRTAPTFIRRSR